MTTTLLPSGDPLTGAHPRTPDPVRPAGASLGLACLVLGLVFLGGAVLALAPGQNALDSWGFTVFPNVLQNEFLRLMSDLGLAPVTGAVSLVAGAVVWRRDRRRALACPLGPALAVGLAELLKLIVGRRFHGALCWPSGTTAAVTAVVTVTVLAARGRGRVAAVVVGTAVVVFEAVALVSFRWHYLSDVLGGVAVGIGCVLFVDAVLHRLRRRRPAPTTAAPAGLAEVPPAAPAL